MTELMVLEYNWLWKNEYAPSKWKERVVIIFFINGDKTDPGNYRDVMLLNIVGNTLIH